MPPPKARLHNKTGKLKNINKTYSSSGPAGQETSSNSSRRNNRAAENTVLQSEAASPAAPSPTASSSDIAQQFEIELCWCIQTMEKSLEAGNISAKQGACHLPKSRFAAILYCVQKNEITSFFFVFLFQPKTRRKPFVC